MSYLCQKCKKKTKKNNGGHRPPINFIGYFHLVEMMSSFLCISESDFALALALCFLSAWEYCTQDLMEVKKTCFTTRSNRRLGSALDMLRGRNGVMGNVIIALCFDVREV